MGLSNSPTPPNDQNAHGSKSMPMVAWRSVHDGKSPLLHVSITLPTKVTAVLTSNVWELEDLSIKRRHFYHLITSSTSRRKFFAPSSE